ncbi:MAG: hypothetical protein ACE5KA_03095 [Nitrososphaerales archaeon]
MSITISGIVFDGPYSLSNWDAPRQAALYCILYKEASTWNLAYVGESSNLDEKSISSHHKRDCWIGKAGSESNLYIAVYPMENSTQKQRQAVEVKIKIENEPPCNV